MSGIESIHWSQMAAARSLGLSFLQTLRFVVVPQAVRRIIPPLLNDFIGLQKDTALVQRDRRHRCLQPGEDRSEQPLQPVVGDHGGHPVRAHHHPAGALRRPPARARQAPHAAGG